MSARTTRPPGPLPETVLRSIPRSRASLRASGDEGSRPAGGATAGGAGAGRDEPRANPAEPSKADAGGAERAGRLARLAELYVGDGFGAMHRKHASVYDLPRLLPHAAGQLVLAEISVLRPLTTDPPRPYEVVLGGAKPSDQLAVLGNLLTRAGRVLSHVVPPASRRRRSRAIRWSVNRASGMVRMRNSTAATT